MSIEIQIDKEGTIRYFNGKSFHRDDGPTIEYSNGNKAWYKDGLLHREDGPAIEWDDGKEWWINGEFIKCENNDVQDQ